MFGASSSYINPYDDSSEGKIGIVANGVTTVIASQEGLIPGGGASGINLGSSRIDPKSIFIPIVATRI